MSRRISAARWPLARWRDSVGVSSATHREACLGGRFATPNETRLGDLRRFVASLDQWPDEAAVTKPAGAVLRVEFFSEADPLVRS